MFVEVKWTVPNMLSLLRILLLPVFAALYLTSRVHPALLWWALGVLILSGATDFLDGIIARRFNQISDFGKILDPLADKLTQVVVVICLATRYPALITLVVIILVKELAQVIGGLFLLKKGDEVRGARWFGKISTGVFYGSMALIVLFKSEMPDWLLIALIVLVAFTMAATLAGYVKTFFGVNKELKK